jgi:uncharacterized protein YbjT (DUF2867 family)
MVRKKMEGDEEQRRAAAREAREAGEAPSARNVTTGASKQRAHLPGRESVTHEEKIAGRHRGKPEWRAGDLADADVKDPAARGAERTFTGRGSAGYTAEHEKVFSALTAAQQENGGEAVHLSQISRAAGLSGEETRALLHDLMQVHHLVTELAGSDTPDMGPRFETKPRL